MIIAQISDTHIALDTPDSDRRIHDFEKTIADINALDQAPDMIIHSGDIVHNGRPDEYECAAGILAKANAPVFLMVGNKDGRENLRAAFPDHTYLANDSPFVDYSIDGYPVRLIVLDTLKAGNNKGEFCDDRRERLVKLLNQNPDRSTVVFTHHPPCQVSVGPEPFHFDGLDSIDKLRQGLRASDQITAIFSGHVHRSAMGEFDGIPVGIMTSVATSLRWDECSDAMSTMPAYYIHTYEPEYGFVTQLRFVMS